MIRWLVLKAARQAQLQPLHLQPVLSSEASPAPSARPPTPTATKTRCESRGICSTRPASGGELLLHHSTGLRPLRRQEASDCHNDYPGEPIVHQDGDEHGPKWRGPAASDRLVRAFGFILACSPLGSEESAQGGWACRPLRPLSPQTMQLVTTVSPVQGVCPFNSCMHT